MLKIRKNALMALAMVLLLSSCGGGSGKVAVPDDNGEGAVPSNGDGKIKKMLPFDIDKDDSSIAFALAISAVTFQGHSFEHLEFQAEQIPGSDDQGGGAIGDFIIIQKLIKPECTNTGVFHYSDNAPIMPYRFRDTKGGIWPQSRYEYTWDVSNCEFSDDDGDILNYADGLKSGFATNSSPSEDVDKSMFEVNYQNWSSYSDLSFEYKSLSGVGSLRGMDLREELYVITGSESGNSTSVRVGDEWQVISKFNSPRLEYNHASGHKMVRTNSQGEIDYGIKGGVTTVNQFSYQVKWNMLEAEKYPIISPNPTSWIGLDPLITGLPASSQSTFPKGDYDLRVELISPLKYENSKDKVGLGVIEGAISVYLDSHFMRADIVYSPGYADITYSRPSGSSQVRFNMNTFEVE